MTTSFAAFILLFSFTFHPAAFSQERRSTSTETNDPIERIRDEGMNHSQVMETLSTLTEVIGPRLTGSPNLKRANEWTRDQLQGWGLGTFRARLVPETIFGASHRAPKHPPHWLSQRLVARFR